MEQWDDALLNYDKAIELDKFEGKYYYNRAQVKAKLDLFDEAIKDFDRAIQYPSDSILYYARYNKGICLRKVGNLDRSVEELKKAVELKPDNPNAHNNLGLSLFERKDFEDALTEYSKAIGCTKIDQGDPNAKQRKDASLHFNNRGLAYYHTGKLTMALSDMNTAIDLNPAEPIYYFNRGNVHYEN
jgi:tetratricopeptide (TPR) repeat protein